MSLLYLIRHASSRMTGDAAERWPLSEQGRREAGVLARQDFWRDIEYIFSSPEPKAIQTAEPAARRWGIPLEISDCLHELRRPRLIPNYEQTVGRLFAEPEVSPDGYESAAEAARRITRCFENLVAAHPGRTLAVISHGLVLTLFLARLENRWPTVAEWRAVPFTGLAIVETEGWQIIRRWTSAARMNRH